MKQEIVQSHHFECAGVEMHHVKNIERLLPVVITVNRNGVTMVLCHALKDNTCTAGTAGTEEAKPICTFVIQPPTPKKTIISDDILNTPLSETNIHGTLLMRMRDSFQVETLGDILRIDFAEIVWLRGAGGQMIRTLLIELKTRGLKIKTRKRKIDFDGRIKGTWAHLIDDTIEFEVTTAEDASSSS